MKSRILSVFFVFFCFSHFSYSDSRSNSDLTLGLEAYRNEDWKGAVMHLKRAVSVENAAEDTLFLLIRSEVNAGENEMALSDCEEFLKTFDDSFYKPLVMFTCGKLLAISGKNERAVLILSDFCHLYPSHELYSESLFYMAEAFLADYDFETAALLYTRIAESYSEHKIAKDAKSRLDEIARRQREEKLLYLLKVTGEENLSTRENYERQLKRYKVEDRVGVRKQLSLEKSRADELEKELAALRSSGEEIKSDEDAAKNHQEDDVEEEVFVPKEKKEKDDNPKEAKKDESKSSSDSSADSGDSKKSQESSEIAEPSKIDSSEIPAAFESGDMTDEEYNRELDGLRKKARKIQQMMEEKQYDSK